MQTDSLHIWTELYTLDCPDSQIHNVQTADSQDTHTESLNNYTNMNKLQQRCK